MEKSSNSFELGHRGEVEDYMPLNGSITAASRWSSRSSPTRHRFIGFIAGVLIACTVLLIYWSYRTPDLIRHLPTILDGTDQRTGKPKSWFNGDCGTSADQARSRGCRFDRVLHSWLPIACTTAEDLADEQDFLKTDWSYYNDTSRSRISSQIVHSGDMEVIYTDWHWHLVHCTYVWKKLHRALLDGRNIDSYMASLHHTNHCSELLLMDMGKNEPLTRIFTKFPTCG